MDRHPDTGLFFSWYSTDKNLRVINQDASSVDNIHLALPLWAVKEKLPTTDAGRRAARLFEKLDFSSFYDPASGLMGGNLKFQNGAWELEKYRFDNAGSEARSIYSLTWALGLLRSKPDPSFVSKTVDALKVETFTWQDGNQSKKNMRTWNAEPFNFFYRNY